MTELSQAIERAVADVRALWRSDADIASMLDAAGWNCEVTTAGEVLAAGGRSSSRSSSEESGESGEPTGSEQSGTLLSGVRRQRGHGTIDHS